MFFFSFKVHVDERRTRCAVFARKFISDGHVHQEIDNDESKTLMDGDQ